MVWSIQMGKQCCEKATQERTDHKEDIFPSRHPKWPLQRVCETLIRTHSPKWLCAYPLPWKRNCCLWICPQKQQAPLGPAIHSHLPISTPEHRKWVRFVNYSESLQKEHHQPNPNIPFTSPTGTELTASRKPAQQEAKGAENITTLCTTCTRLH